MKCVDDCILNNNCLDLPSLAKIQENCSSYIHKNMGHVILESMI